MTGRISGYGQERWSLPRAFGLADGEAQPIPLCLSLYPGFNGEEFPFCHQHFHPLYTPIAQREIVIPIASMRRALLLASSARDSSTLESAGEF
jgi:hypothetical protein